MSAELSVEDGEIVATFPDHTVSSYDLNGKLKVAFHIQDFSQLTYETTEIINCSAEDGYYNPTPATKVAPCMSYEAESGWNGLMTSDGRILTPPSYYKIEAISSDLYLCKIDYDRGVIVDGKGRIVSSKNE